MTADQKRAIIQAFDALEAMQIASGHGISRRLACLLCSSAEEQHEPSCLREQALRALRPLMISILRTRRR